MQITIGQEARVLKTGTNKQGGEWELIAVKSAKGTEYTTFDRKVKHLGVGSVIEVGEPEEKNGKLSFEKVVDVISEVAPGVVSDGKEMGSYKRDIEGIQFEYGLKMEMQEINRVSVEAQTAFNGLVSIFSASTFTVEMAEELKPVWQKALQWVEVKLDASMQNSKPIIRVADKKAPAETIISGKAPESEHPFPNIGALLKWCMDNGISRDKFMEINQVKEKDLPKLNLDTAYDLVLTYLKQNPLTSFVKE